MKTRISFTGDILCEIPMMRAYRRGGHYDFSSLGFDLKKTYGADLVVGNLETVFAGEKAGYTDDFYSFNAPDSFVQALRNLGVDCVTTANNHALDRGADGLRRTLDVLDANGIRHVGTYRTPEEAAQPVILTVGGVRLGLLAGTQSTNYKLNETRLPDGDAYALDLLSDPTAETPRPRTAMRRIKEALLTKEQRTRIVRRLGMTYNIPQIDDIPLDELYLRRIDERIAALRPQCDILAACVHMGGQFNERLGTFSVGMMEHLLAAGADAVIANHSHIVQGHIRDGEKLGCYCLGNLILPPDCAYLLEENLPACSVVLHLDIEDGKPSYAFSVVKLIGDEKRGYELCDASALYERLDGAARKSLGDECRRIYRAFTGISDADPGVAREYSLP